MRLFVAIEIPSEIRLELERRTSALRSGLPKARWVKPVAPPAPDVSNPHATHFGNRPAWRLLQLS